MTTTPETGPRAGTRSWTDVELVDGPARTVLAVDGSGPTESQAFASAVRALFGVRSALGGGDVPMEGTYRSRSVEFDLADPDGWDWTITVSAPDGADEDAVARAAATAGADPAPRLQHQPATRAVRTLNTGAYADEGPALAALREAAAERGWRVTGPHTETYLSDPSTTPEAELRTLLRYPVQPAVAAPTG